jgi:long chain fatty acid CoA FadD26
MACNTARAVKSPLECDGTTADAQEGFHAVSETTVPELIERRADEQPDDTAYTFYDYESDPAGTAESITWSELRDRVLVVADQLSHHGSPGDRAMVLAPQGLDYIVGFLGAIQAGFIAVPLSVPQPGQHDERVSGAMTDSTPVAVLTTSAVVDEVRTYIHAQPGQRPPRVIEVDALDFFSGVNSPPASPAVPSPPKIAYLQYTSGSTRRPAGVSMTHANVAANLEQAFPDYLEALGTVSPRHLTVVSWAPFYHDMGMVVGIFIPLYSGCSAVLMSPVSFLQKPVRWLQHIAAHPNVFTAGPNFAYEVLMARTSDEDMAGLDLSRAAVLINGAERVRGSTVRRFNERFAAFGLPDSAMRTTWGMAEATVYVASSPGGRPPAEVRFDTDKLTAGHAEVCGTGGSELVSHGAPRSCDFRIVDPETRREKSPGEVGEVWVHGPQIAAGYWHNPELSEQVFNGQLAAGSPTGPWLKSGDLGVMFDGELYIIGRMKDLLIVDGRNHYPDDIEATVAKVTGGRVAAVSVPDGGSERLVVVAELKTKTPELSGLKTQVSAAISKAHGVRVADLVLVGPGSIPVTTSGKVRRSASAERYRLGHFSRLDAT